MLPVNISKIHMLPLAEGLCLTIWCDFKNAKNCLCWDASMLGDPSHSHVIAIAGCCQLLLTQTLNIHHGLPLVGWLGGWVVHRGSIALPLLPPRSCRPRPVDPHNFSVRRWWILIGSKLYTPHPPTYRFPGFPMNTIISVPLVPLWM